MIARIVLVLLFIGFWFVLLPTGYPMPRGFLGALMAESVMLGAVLWAIGAVRSERSVDTLHAILLCGELLAHAAMFYFLGGVMWLGAVAFLYGIVYAASFLTWRQAVLFASAVAATFVAVMALDGTGALPHQDYLPQGPERYRDMDYLVPTAVGFIGVLSTITFWMVFLGTELRRERDVAVRAYDELARAQAELKQLYEELELKVEERTRVLAFRAEHDQLTGLLNRGAVTRRCEEVLAQARRDGREVAILIADGDNFKVCNDTIGHAYGDDVLRALADTVRESSRESDFVGRLGGDEFMMVLVSTSVAGAVRYAKRLLKRLDARKRLAEASHPDRPFPTLSVGIAIFPEHGDDVDQLISVADQAMYAAKKGGGNSWGVGVADEVQEIPPAHVSRVSDASPAPIESARLRTKRAS